MTIISGLGGQRKSSESYPFAGYCKESYNDYKRMAQTIVNSSKGVEDIEMVEFPLKAKGPHDEPLSIFAVKRVYESPKQVIIRFSGTHGIEGYIGAAGQLYGIESAFHIPYNTMIIEIFAYNVWGFCNLRRSSSKNYDYNFTHLSKSTSDLDELYKDATAFKVKKKKRAFSFPLIRRKESKRKICAKSFKGVLERGQSHDARGICYNAGDSLDEGAEALFPWLADQLKSAAKVVCIDIHSEPGTWGEESLKIFDYERTNTFDGFTALFGKKVQHIVAEEAKNGDVCSKVFNIVKEVNAAAEVIGIRQTVETYPVHEVIDCLFNENQAYVELDKYGKKLSLDHEYKKQLLECFYPSSLRWRNKAVNKIQILLIKSMRYVSSSRYFTHFNSTQ